MSAPVVADGTLYGISNKRKGQFVALDAATGAVRWATEGREGEHASILLTPAHVLFLTNAGELVVARKDAGEVRRGTAHRSRRRRDVGGAGVRAGGLVVRDAQGLMRLHGQTDDRARCAGCWSRVDAQAPCDAAAGAGRRGRLRHRPDPAPAVVFLHGAFMDRAQLGPAGRRRSRSSFASFATTSGRSANRRAPEKAVQRSGRSAAAARSPEDRSRASRRAFVRRRRRDRLRAAASRSRRQPGARRARPRAASCRPQDERKAAGASSPPSRRATTRSSTRGSTHPMWAVSRERADVIKTSSRRSRGATWRRSG